MCSSSPTSWTRCWSTSVLSRSVPAPTVRVSTLELFFDLVFVFTITQLTARLSGALTVPGLLRVMLMLVVIWWMYDGYAWLTNTVAPTTAWRRALIVTGMAGFLTIALAIPDGYAATGWAFGLGYFVVNLVHSGLFIASGGQGVLAAMRGLGPLNLASASLVLVGGLVPEPGRYLLWCAAAALQIASPYLHPIGGFTISAPHFVERHGLVVIIALGESVIAIGVGVGARVNAGLIAAALLGLVLVYYLWSTYFGGDDERAEEALAGIADTRDRARAALRAYGYAHYPLLLGIVVLAAGVKKGIGHAFAPIGAAQALALGGGVALFLLGDVAFRWVLRIGQPGYRLACVVVALATVPLGLVNGVGQLAALAVALAVLLSRERRAGAGRPRHARAAG
jgi:low temperature requirement protein LtrA